MKNGISCVCVSISLAMDCTSLERLTIEALPASLPCKVAYVVPQESFGNGFLWWDMQYLHAADRTLCPGSFAKKDWTDVLIRAMSKLDKSLTSTWHSGSVMLPVCYSH